MAKGYKTGGRQLGAGNKDKELKQALRAHSLRYFIARPNKLSRYEEDLDKLDPIDRVNANLRLLKFHQAEMKAVDMNMEVETASPTLLDKLRQLADGES